MEILIYAIIKKIQRVQPENSITLMNCQMIRLFCVKESYAIVWKKKFACFYSFQIRLCNQLRTVESTRCGDSPF
jgi:hypothetical protein